MDQPLRDNQALWDAWTRIHVPSAFYDVASFRDGTRPIRLSDYERDEVGPVDGRTLLHLQCHFGLDTLSWARLGATVTGLDFSPEAVATARSLAAELGIDARFVESNLYDAAEAIHETFDIVYTSRGVLGWMPDIDGWARVAAQFVKPGGFLYVTDIHPVAQVFADDAAPGELRLAYPYWSHPEPLTFDVHGSYADPAAPTDGLVEHGWDHSLGEIVTAVINAGLQVDLLHELPFVEWPVPFLVEGGDGRYRLPADAPGELPLFFSLRASRPAAVQLRRGSEGSPGAGGGTAERAGVAEIEVRRRSADELHDVAGQSLVAAYRFLDAARARSLAAGSIPDPDVEAAHGQVVAAMRELRAVVDTLAPPGLAQRGLAAAIRDWAARQGAAGFDVSVHGDLAASDPAGRNDAADPGSADLAWFDLVTTAAAVGRQAGTSSHVVIDLREAGDGRIIRITGSEPVSGPTVGHDDERNRVAASMRRLAGRLGATMRFDPDGSTGSTVVIDGRRRTADHPDTTTPWGEE